MGIIGSSAPFRAPPVDLQLNTRIAPPKPGFNDRGGLGDKLNRVAAAFMDAGGNSEGSNNILQQMQWEQEQEQLQSYRQAQLARQNQPEGVNLGDNGYGEYDPSSRTFRTLREPTQTPLQRTPLERNIELYKQYNPNATPEQLAEMIQRGTGGYQYSEPYLEKKNDLTMGQIGTRAANSMKLKLTPGARAAGRGGGGGGHPSATRVVGGRTYYKLNGAWYDNPEGR